MRLRNYRGTREREVRFAPRGVTVVHGPNEIGKSSLAEAMDLVFDELDSAAKQRVRAVQPVDRDAGSEIEIEVETGPYRFTLEKRFHRQPVTRLRVERPRAETWTGREAHQRVEAILAETLDRELWRALRVEQGRGLEQASWHGRPALAVALGRAAGLASAGAREETLLEAAREEYARYFTPTGRQRRDLEAKSREVARLRHAVRELEEALRSLERDVARDAELRAARPGLEARAAAAESALREAEASAARTESLREALDTARARRDAAAAEEQRALHEARARGQLVAIRAAHEADALARSEELESAEPELLGARAELDHASGAHAAARGAREMAALREARCRADLALLRAHVELAGLRQREERLGALAAEAADAEKGLSDSPLDAAAVEAIRAAERELVRARDRLEAEEPLVRIAAHADLEVQVDGRSLRIAAGESFEQRVADSLALSLPGVADLGVVAGAGAVPLRKQVEEAQTRWRWLCAEAGVADHAEALRVLERRAEAERALAACRQSEALLLAGETREALRARTRRLEERVAAELAARGDESLPADEDEAAARLALSEAALARARDAESATAARASASAERCRALEERGRDTEMRLSLARLALGDLETRLSAARAECSDEELARRLDTCAARARTLDAEAREAARALEERAAAQAEAQLAAARARLESAQRALRACRDEQIGIATRLEVRGEQGLFEQLEEAHAALLRAEREESGERRRAEAARLLYETLRGEREACQRAYAGPLRARIESLGAEIFGTGFEVELDEALRVAARAQHGVSLAFDQLSAGAREQLALLSRLACATLVADDGGAPLLLDDALGHSDPQRLAGLGRALTEAGRRCQVIVLTCDPARYRHVEGAQWVALAP